MNKTDFELLCQRLQKEGRSYFILISPTNDLKDEQALFATYTGKSFNMKEMFTQLFQTKDQEDVKDFFLNLMIRTGLEELLFKIKIFENKKKQGTN